LRIEYPGALYFHSVILLATVRRAVLQPVHDESLTLAGLWMVSLIDLDEVAQWLFEPQISAASELIAAS
jgi:hypothetical protein